jgi:16S rRNA (guanine527-N7)-methyltransferase
MISDLILLLTEKSEHLNLFSAGDRLKLAEKHIPDSLKVLDFWRPKENEKIIDLGTGGGLPGLALAVSCPHANFTLLDSHAKKIDAVSEIANELNLKNVDFICDRIEEVAHEKKYREQFNFVTARALAELPTLLEYASGFLKVGGQLFAWKSGDYAEELKNSLRAQKEFNLIFKKAFPYILPGGESRTILMFEKTKELTHNYPRKTGTPKANPI